MSPVLAAHRSALLSLLLCGACLPVLAADDEGPGAIEAAFRAGEFTKVIELAASLPADDPRAAEITALAHQNRGVARFYNAQIDASIADFDAYLAQYPERAPHHWQRGISLYYADRFEEGLRQFEIHQGVNSQDVENAIFHFICAARSPSIGLAKARANFIPITDDRRVPMAELHALFAGTGSEGAVLEAAMAAPARDRDNALCYAHLYLGLYHEALGHMEESLRHIRKAAVDYAQDHYMGQVAKVHLELRTKK
jgi:lipoprotein NlpI